MASGISICESTGTYEENIAGLRDALASADRIVIGAGAGLSTAAGFTYSGERFNKYFSDFGRKYGFADMYSGGFYPYNTREEFWAYWSRYIYINRYMDAPTPLYEEVLSLVNGRDYFVVTTNVDHCFQKAGIDKERLFYTQGDYGLFQCSKPCHDSTYDNRDTIIKMLTAQGYTFAPDGSPASNGAPSTAVPTELLPRCPRCGEPMVMNLRSDDTFVEDEGWRAAAKRYSDYMNTPARGRKTVYLELGVGFNTPGIIKIPFWQMTERDENAVYACINMGEAYCLSSIEKRAVLINGDIAKAIADLKK